jgi:hypothetical protein
MRPLAELALLFADEHVSEVRESAVIEGTAVYVCTPPDFGEMTAPVVFTAGPSMYDILRDRVLAAAVMPPPRPFVLSSIA